MSDPDHTDRHGPALSLLAENYVSVAVDGTLSDVRAEDAADPPAKIVITLPDFYGYWLSRALTAACQASAALTPKYAEGYWTDVERELSAALTDAVESTGYTSPNDDHAPQRPVTAAGTP